MKTKCDSQKKRLVASPEGQSQENGLRYTYVHTYCTGHIGTHSQLHARARWRRHQAGKPPGCSPHPPSVHPPWQFVMDGQGGRRTDGRADGDDRELGASRRGRGIASVPPTRPSSRSGRTHCLGLGEAMHPPEASYERWTEEVGAGGPPNHRRRPTQSRGGGA
eukprot:6190754-Pleurochrysis_carterae.AAC.5